MTQLPTKSELPRPADAEGISKWNRTYAQNRRMGMVVLLLIYFLDFAAISEGSRLAGDAYRADNTPLLIAAIALLIVAFGALLILSVPKWGAKLQHRIVQTIYAREDNVALSASREPERTWLWAMGICFALCVTGLVAMFFFFNIPTKYVQPISALYSVPFLVGLWLLQRPVSGHVALLWPTLITIHALLILAGAPILFTGGWEGLNMLIPTFGYGLLTGLLSHLYSRVAVRRLKSLAQTDKMHTEPSAADTPS